MRRLLAVKLLIALLVPWFLSQGAGLRAVVPCPMHSGHTLANNGPSGTPGRSHEGMARHRDGSSHHGTTAKGCNCAGDCGRTVTHIAFPATQNAPVRIVASLRIDTRHQQTFHTAAAYNLPFATGPPQRLPS